MDQRGARRVPWDALAREGRARFGSKGDPREVAHDPGEEDRNARAVGVGSDCQSDCDDEGHSPIPNGERRVTNYATAGFFSLFLSDGATRGAWQRVVREFFGNGDWPDAFAGSMGDAAKRMDESFRKFLAKL